MNSACPSSPHTQPFIQEIKHCPADIRPSSDCLKGLGLAVKDLFSIAGYANSAGNPDWLAQQEVATATAPLVKQLLNAGCDLVGLTLTDELAYSLMGNNIHYGRLVNPAAAKRLTGGSSSGSAVAVAAGLADIGLGTDTGGSIRVPASFCGLYGLRPTHGVLDSDGLIGLAPSFDTPGWMSRDLASMDRVTELLIPEHSTPSPEGFQLWWPDDLPKALAQTLLAKFANAGISVELRLLSKHLREQAATCFRILQAREANQLHGAWISQTQPRLGPDIAARFAQAAQLSLADEQAALNTLAQLKDQLNSSAWVLLPTTGGAAPLLQASAAQLDQVRQQLQGLTAYAGLFQRPQITLPLLQDQQAPWGLSLMGPRFSDRMLIQQAKRFLPCF